LKRAKTSSRLQYQRVDLCSLAIVEPPSSKLIANSNNDLNADGRRPRTFEVNELLSLVNNLIATPSVLSSTSYQCDAEERILSQQRQWRATEAKHIADKASRTEERTKWGNSSPSSLSSSRPSPLISTPTTTSTSTPSSISRGGGNMITSLPIAEPVRREGYTSPAAAPNAVIHSPHMGGSIPSSYNHAPVGIPGGVM
jgi:hypothetical protein